MAKRFLFEDEKPASTERSFGYLDGFRFGFGMFVAWLLGLMLVSAAGAVFARLLHLHY
jgi:hypothetical protein